MLCVGYFTHLVRVARVGASLKMDILPLGKAIRTDDIHHIAAHIEHFSVRVEHVSTLVVV